MNSLFLAIFLVISLHVHEINGRYHPNVPLRDCPESCVCENSVCNYVGKSKKKIKCLGVQVVCNGNSANVTSIPNDIPKNVTGIVMSGYTFEEVNLDEFYSFNNLRDLVLNENQIRKITINKILKNVKTLNLQDNNLATLPHRDLGRLKSVEELTLRNNKLTTIRGVRFPKKVDILDIRNNSISSLHGGLFKKSKLLRVLKLNDNQIDTIHLNAFENTPSIEVLDLENNKLTKLPRNIFSKLLSTWYINLRGNKIKSIHKFAFLYFGSRSNSRNQIDLRDNQIRFLSVDLLSVLLERKGFFKVNFAGNPVFCDCNVLNLREEAGDLLMETEHMVCTGPPENEGRLVARLKFEDCCF